MKTAVIILAVLFAFLVFFACNSEARPDSLVAKKSTAKLTIPAFSLGRFFSPWFTPLSYDHRGGDIKAEFGGGVSYFVSNHVCISFSAHKDWNSRNKSFRASLKLF